MGIKNRLKIIMNNFMREVKTPVFIPLASGTYLKDRNILITGGAGGIGLAITEACLRNGSNVVIAGRSQNKLDNACNSLIKKMPNAKSNIFTLVMDVQDVESIDEKLNMANELFPQRYIDTLINNAGVAAGKNFGSTDSKSYDKVLDTNLKGTYFLSQDFSNHLILKNIKGNILNISSSSGVRPAISPYMISKWGEVGLTQGLAKKLIPYDIVVNGIAPGPTATAMLNKDGSDLSYDNSPAGRYAAPEEVGNLAVFMISDMGRMIVGDTVFITGGCGTLTLDDIKY